MTYRTRAPFKIRGRWIWLTWDSPYASVHAAVIELGVRLGASAWDVSQADHALKGEAGF